MSLEKALPAIFVGGLVTIVSYLSIHFYEKWKKQRIPTKWIQVGIITKIYIYPLKSGNRIELQEAECTERGLVQTSTENGNLRLKDRELMVYGAKDNEFRTARTYPKMVKIDVTVHDKDHLAIDAPTMRTLYVKIPKRGENTETNVKAWYNEKINGIDCGDEAATWFSRYIIERESGLRLAYNDNQVKRDIRRSHQKLLAYYKNLNSDSAGLFQDLTSLMVINQASVNDLNGKLVNSVPCESFRPNIIIEGPNLEAYVEDKWDWIKLGDQVVCRNVKECTRCVFTTIHPDTAERDPNREPLKTLETYRKSQGPEKSPVMGVHLGVKQTGLLKVGDPIFVAIQEL